MDDCLKKPFNTTHLLEEAVELEVAIQLDLSHAVTVKVMIKWWMVDALTYLQCRHEILNAAAGGYWESHTTIE